MKKSDIRLFACITEIWCRRHLGQRHSIFAVCRKWRVANLNVDMVEDIIERDYPPNLEDIRKLRDRIAKYKNTCIQRNALANRIKSLYAEIDKLTKELEVWK